MGDVTGSSGSFTFWDASTDVHLFYGLDGKCINCDGATLFQRSTDTEFYEVVRYCDYLHNVLNDESEKQSYGMMWSSQLELVDEWVKPSSESEAPMSCSVISSSSVASQSTSSSESETSMSNSVVSQSTSLSMAAIDALSPLVIAVVLVFTCASGF